MKANGFNLQTHEHTCTCIHTCAHTHAHALYVGGQETETYEHITVSF